jgi:hypothetical protein
VTAMTRYPDTFGFSDGIQINYYGQRPTNEDLVRTQDVREFAP